MMTRRTKRTFAVYILAFLGLYIGLIAVAHCAPVVVMPHGPGSVPANLLVIGVGGGYLLWSHFKGRRK